MIIRRHAARLDDQRTGRKVNLHVFRRTAAVHLLKAGVEVNVIRGWLGHAFTTNRYAEINTKTKEEALRACEPPNTSERSRPSSHRVNSKKGYRPPCGACRRIRSGCVPADRAAVDNCRLHAECAAQYRYRYRILRLPIEREDKGQ